MSISAVVLTKNEERNIEKCLESLAFCDEVIVVDDGSTDTTVALVKKHDACIIEHPLENDFAKQRNFALSQTTGDWVLFIDADEVVSEKLRNEINKYTNNPINKCVGYFIPRIDTMWGKKMMHGEQGNIKLLRLAKKDAGRWSGRVHEVWAVSGATQTLENPLLHYPHQTIAEFLEEVNFYTTLRAEELYQQGLKASWIDILAYPKAKFFRNYFLKLGILDGIPGLIMAIFMSLHSFLVRGKLWQLNDKHS